MPSMSFPDCILWKFNRKERVVGSVCLVALHGFLDGHSETTFGVHCQAQDGNGRGDFFVAGNGGSDRQAESLELDLQDGASVTFNGRSTAD